MDKQTKSTIDLTQTQQSAAKEPSNFEKQVARAREIYGPKPDGRILNTHFVKD